MAFARILQRVCACGADYLILQDEQAAELLRDAGDACGVQVITTGRGPGRCNRCGASLPVPPGEVLDTDRSPLGRWLEQNVSGEAEDHK